MRRITWLSSSGIEYEAASNVVVLLPKGITRHIVTLVVAKQAIVDPLAQSGQALDRDRH